MDILIDLILWIIKAAADHSNKAKPPPITPQEIERQRALAAQLQALQQQALTSTRAKPVAVRPGQRKSTKPVNWGVPTPPRWVAPSVPKKPAVATRSRVVESVTPAPALRPAPPVPARVAVWVPLLMGEILGPPLALREPEF
jgi:hypothetical protein